MDDGKCLRQHENASRPGEMDTVLAVLEPDHDDQVAERNQQIVEDRQAARKAKDFATVGNSERNSTN